MLTGTPYDRFWQAPATDIVGRSKAQWDSGTVLVRAVITQGDWLRTELELPQAAAQARAGHFLLLGLTALDPYLLRPYYITAVNQATGQVSVLLPRQSKLGQAMLQLPTEGARLSFIGPIGTSFPNPAKDSGLLLLIASGHGVAAMDLARSESIAVERPVLAVLVGDSPAWSDAHAVPNFDALPDLLAKEAPNSPPQVVWASGSEQLMSQVRSWATDRNISCYVTLERHIACGVGTCLGCTVPASGGGMWRVCADGPVFESEEVLVDG